MNANRQLMLSGWVCAALTLTACGGAPTRPGQLGFLAPDKYIVEPLPSQTNAAVTGQGCAPTSVSASQASRREAQREAETKARQVAAYNLRKVTGPARYSVHFGLPEITELTEERVCVQVRANTVP